MFTYIKRQTRESRTKNFDDLTYLFEVLRAENVKSQSENCEWILIVQIDHVSRTEKKYKASQTVMAFAS